MGIVTLTGHLGAMGYVAPILAERLGYRLVGRELVIEAGAALGWSEEQVGDFDERTGGFRRRVADFLDRLALSQVDVSDVVSAFAMTYSDAAAIGAPAGDRYFAELKRQMNLLADEGDAVIIGRGGQSILGDRADAVHIRVACPVEERVTRVAARDHMSVEETRTRIELSDREREAWHQRYVGIDYRSPYHYSLVVNTGELSDDLAASLIATVVDAKLGVATP